MDIRITDTALYMLLECLTQKITITGKCYLQQLTRESQSERWSLMKAEQRELFVDTAPAVSIYTCGAILFVK